MATRRKYLCGGRTPGRHITLDMEEVYRLIDKGMKLNDVAEHLGVSRTTLYRQHELYQRRLEALGDDDSNEIFNDLDID